MPLEDDTVSSAIRPPPVAGYLATWFVWEGWQRARGVVIELTADFIVATSLWLLYAAFAAAARLLITNKLVLEIADAIHACAAIASFSLMAGLGVLHVVTEVWGHRPEAKE